MLTADLFFNLDRYAHAGVFTPDQPVWSALASLKNYMEAYDYPDEPAGSLADGIPVPEPLVLHEKRLFPASGCQIEMGDTGKGGLIVKKEGRQLAGASLIMAGAILIGRKIALGQGALIEGGATIKAPAIIGNCTEIRQGAYMRGYCLIGDRCVVGHTTEVKHSIFLDDAKAGHFAYLGDSILGNDANLGAGTKFANLRFLPGSIKISYQGQLLDTGMRKFGAILGDKSQTGCNSVTNPGTIFGKRGILMPNTTALSGYHTDSTRIR